jgi:hypothetical protein
MKKIFLFTLLMFTNTILLGQTAYIQVEGEPNLSVFLNSKFKAKTTVELGGCVIENVPPGKNLIKIVKEGFIPFEETITLKSGEVFSYKVKPFIKNKVTIEESGNTGETDKKATIETGKLIIQSVPINIKITIPSIEGISNTTKAKDEWIVNNISTGTCEATFIYNKKVIKKTFEIIGGETTNVFINMLNGDYKTRNTIEEKIKVTAFIDSISTAYKSNPKLKREDFKNNKSVSTNDTKQQSANILTAGFAAFIPKKAKTEIPAENTSENNIILEKYGYTIIVSKKNRVEVTNDYNKIVSEIKKFPAIYRTIGAAESIITDTTVRVKFSLSSKKLFILFEELK